MIRSFFLFCLLLTTFSLSAQVRNIYVSVRGKDTNSGTISMPVKTLKRALVISESVAAKDVKIQLMGGTYYLPETIVISSSEKRRSLEISAYQNQNVTLSAGRMLHPEWHLFKNGIYRARLLSGISFERLYVNGILQTLARYPNADSTRKIFNGTSHDATYYVRVLTWGNPFGGYVHALDENKKGSLHYKITGVDDTDNVELDGGWQFKKPVHPDTSERFVENLLAELDAPGEWYFDKTTDFLYYLPSKNVDVSKAVFEVSNLKNSVILAGTRENPVRNVSFQNLNFRHNERTFMENREKLEDSDWAIYRGGAVVLEGTENCKIINCSFTDLGGNGVMLSGSNKMDTIRNCHFDRLAATGIALIATEDHGENLSARQCFIGDNRLSRCGEIEKRSAGIYLYKTQQISVLNNTIDQIPGRAIRMEGDSESPASVNANQISKQFQEIDN